MASLRKDIDMMRILKPTEVIYDFSLDDIDTNQKGGNVCEYDNIYTKIKDVLSINRDNFNIYLTDDYSKDKVEYLRKYIEDIYKEKAAPKDICYVVYDDRTPKVLIVGNGIGSKLKSSLEKIQNNINEAVYKFYNSTVFEDKEDILDELHKRRAVLIEGLMEKAKEEGFDIKATTHGFAFLPLKVEGESMSTKEYDDLDLLIKEDILEKVSKLKLMAEEVLDELKGMEVKSIEEIKKILIDFLTGIIEEQKGIFYEKLQGENEAIEYLDTVCKHMLKDLVYDFTGVYEDDEEKININILKYNINVLVDNKGMEHPSVFYEENPTVFNLIGEIEYENHNGTYITDVTMIKAGTLLKCNEGVIIIRLGDLLNNGGAYYYLRKALLTGKLNFNYHKSYLEILSLNGLNTSDIDIDVKVIVIGDMESYDILYNYDEDFKRVFKIRVESDPLIDISDSGKEKFINRIKFIIDKNKLFSVSSSGVKEVAKYLSRKAENNKKIIIDELEITRILNLANVRALKDNKSLIEGKHIVDVAYEKDLLEKDFTRMYEDGHILINVKDSIVGSINALSVIGTEYYSFGRPMRVTCVCYKGNGSIIDVHRESKLSGSIHEKSINILRAYLNQITDPYKKLPIDFHLSFEQVYGKIDGDSASVAETVCMLSALSKIPIRQNIAVTGSINQFGNVQPIGGVNEKIEGFFNVCKMLDTMEGKGVLIPETNVNSLILSEEVEKAIEEGKFKIYTMTSIRDAVEVLMSDEEENVGYIFNEINKEIQKYYGKDEEES